VVLVLERLMKAVLRSAYFEEHPAGVARHLSAATTGVPVHHIMVNVTFVS